VCLPFFLFPLESSVVSREIVSHRCWDGPDSRGISLAAAADYSKTLGRQVTSATSGLLPIKLLHTLLILLLLFFSSPLLSLFSLLIAFAGVRWSRYQQLPRLSHHHCVCTVQKKGDASSLLIRGQMGGYWPIMQCKSRDHPSAKSFFLCIAVVGREGKEEEELHVDKRQNNNKKRRVRESHYSPVFRRRFLVVLDRYVVVWFDVVWCRGRRRRKARM